MARTTRYDRNGLITGYSETPDRPRRLSKKQQEAETALGLAIIRCILAFVALAPLCLPVIFLNLWVIHQINVEWHVVFRLLLVATVNVGVLLFAWSAITLTPALILNSVGAVIYALYGFIMTAALTGDPQSKWTLGKYFPKNMQSMIAPVQNGDLIWSCIFAIVGAALGWALFNFLKRKTVRS